MFLFSIPVTVTRDIWTDFAIPIFGFILTIILTRLTITSVNKNTKDQIENQNKESHTPRLRLNKVEYINLDEVNGDYEMVSNTANSNNDEIEKKYDLRFRILIENIGYGIATDIKFYSLFDGKRINGAQSILQEKNQKMKSTLEIPKGETENIILSPIAALNNDEYFKDTITLICTYNDLNKNTYKFLIGILIKEINEDENNININYYYYQENTDDYNELVNRYSENYQLIINEINKK